MNILMLGSLSDLENNIVGKNILLTILSNLKKNGHNIKVFSKFMSVRQLIPKEDLLEAKSLKHALLLMKERGSYFGLMSSPSLNDIDFEKLELYHNNHDKPITLVCRNLVKGRTTPVYKLNDKKDIVSVNKKRYASCSLYLIDATIDLTNFTTLTNFVGASIDTNQLKAFVHTGFFHHSTGPLTHIKYTRKKQE